MTGLSQNKVTHKGNGMRVSICCVGALIGAVGMVAEMAVASENNSSLPPAIAGRPAATPKRQAQYDAAFDICQTVVPANHADSSTANVLTPTAVWSVYFHSHGLNIEPSAPLAVSLVAGPSYGVLQSNGYADGVYIYRPNEEYFGTDQMIFVVDAQGKKFKVIYSVHVSRGAPEYGPPECPDGFGINELRAQSQKSQK